MRKFCIASLDLDMGTETRTNILNPSKSEAKKTKTVYFEINNYCGKIKYELVSSAKLSR